MGAPASIGARAKIAGALFAWLLPSPAGVAATELCGTVEGYLSAAESPYDVSCDLEIEEGEDLEIEAGVLVRFAPGTRLAVEGTLEASGTALDPILFTGTASPCAPGDWEGIDVHRTADLQHVRVECAVRGLFFYPGAGGSVTDSGFSDMSYAALELFEDTWPTLRRLTATGGPRNGIVISGQRFTSGTWTAAGIPYILWDPTGTRFGGAVFTIEPGTIVKFDPSAELVVEGDLIAEGTAANPIVFTSVADDSVGGDTSGDGNTTAPGPGIWRGLDLGGAFAEHRLRHLDIRYAWHGMWLGTGWTVQLHDSAFSDLGGLPVALGADAYPVVSGLSATRCLGGNGIALFGTTGWGFFGGTWTDAGIPYVVLGDLPYGFNMTTRSTLTIDPGVVFKLTPGSSLGAYTGLQAEGTPDRRIVFTSIRDDSVGGDTNGDGDATAPAAGDWDTLELPSPLFGDDRIVSHAEIRYATTGVTTAGHEDDWLSDVLITDAITGVLCNSQYVLNVDRVGILRTTTGFHALDHCNAVVTGARISLATIGILCDGTITVHRSDIHRTSVGLRADDGCTAVVTETDFVGATFGVLVLDTPAAVDLGNVSDPDPTNDGRNNFACNTFDVRNYLPDPTPAENNWWGEIPPDTSQILGPVDIDPYDTKGSNALIPDLTASLDADRRDVHLEWRDRAPSCGYRVWRSTTPDGGFTDVSGPVTNAWWDDLSAGSAPDGYFWFITID